MDFMSKMLTALNAALYFLSGFWPRNQRKLLFGAWLGAKFADNPKYLLLHLDVRAPELDLVWIAQDNVRTTLPAGLRVRFVRRGSLAALYEIVTAGYCFITHGRGDISLLNVLRGATVCYLGHGVALKHHGTPSDQLPNRLMEFARSLVRKAECYHYFIASSERHSQKLLHEFAINGATCKNILATGQPRIDYLIENKADNSAKQVREKLLSEHNIPALVKTITYLPTFRDKCQRAFSFLSLEGADGNRLQSLLEKFNAIIIEKSHFIDERREGKRTAANYNRIFSLGGHGLVDTQELLLASDLLITDYSGCYLDYLLLDRPVILFAYDRGYYTSLDRGLYFDLDTIAAGPVVESFDVLCDAIERDLRHPDSHREQREKVRNEMMRFETGDACRKICSAILRINS